jgi:pilus assembly protein CpaB
MIVLALVSGGSAAVGINTLRKQASGLPADTVLVVVAAADIPRGVTVTADMVKTRPWPRDAAPAGALTDPDEALNRATASALVKDEPVLDAKLAARGAGRGMAALIPMGMRAFTIQTPNLASGVAGFVLPGNKVDVLLTVGGQSLNDETGGGSTTTLLQNVEILAVDQRVDAPADNKVDPRELRSVTLLVTPDQAAKLDLGQNKGTLHLSLRNPADSSPANTRPATLADLRFHQDRPWDERLKGVLEAFGKAMAQRRPEKAPAALPAPPPPPVGIRTIRGTQDGMIYLPPDRTNGGE